MPLPVPYGSWPHQFRSSYVGRRHSALVPPCKSAPPAFSHGLPLSRSEAKYAELISPREEAPRVLSLEAGENESDAVGQAPERSSWMNSRADLDPSFHFVESPWFFAISTSVVAANVVTIVLEMDHPRRWQSLRFLDNLMLCFYIVELLLRGFHQRWKLFEGSPRHIASNVLDLSVVSAGVLDQWLLPLLEAHKRGGVLSFLRFLRLLRLMRVLKIVRAFLHADLSWAHEPMFQSLMGAVIASNAVVMGLETDIKWEGWFLVEQAFLVIYCFELMVRLRHEGMQFLSWYNSDITWNALDLVIVSSAALDGWIIPMVGLVQKTLTFSDEEDADEGKKSGGSTAQAMMLMRMLRLMRILRLAKLIKSVRPLYFLVASIMSALQGVLWVLVLTLTFLYALAIMVTRLVGHGLLWQGVEGEEVSNISSPFRSVPESIFTLFRFMSGAPSEDEEVAIEDLMRELPGAKFLFVFFFISSSWTMLSILTAVVSENMITTTGKQEEELALEHAEEDRATYVQELTELFVGIHLADGGQLYEVALESFLRDKTKSSLIVQYCHASTLKIMQIFRALQLHSDVVTLDDFIEATVDLGKTHTEKVIMKMDTQFTSFQRRTDDALEFLRRAAGESARHESNLIQDMMQSKQDEMMRFFAASFDRLEQQLAGRSNLVRVLPANSSEESAHEQSKGAERSACAVHFAEVVGPSCEEGTTCPSLVTSRSSANFEAGMAAATCKASVPKKVSLDAAGVSQENPQSCAVEMSMAGGGRGLACRNAKPLADLAVAASCRANTPVHASIFVDDVANEKGKMLERTSIGPDAYDCVSRNISRAEPEFEELTGQQQERSDACERSEQFATRSEVDLGGAETAQPQERRSIAIVEEFQRFGTSGSARMGDVNVTGPHEFQTALHEELETHA